VDRVKSLGAVHGEKNRGVFNWLAASQGLLPALPFPLIALAATLAGVAVALANLGPMLPALALMVLLWHLPIREFFSRT